MCSTPSTSMTERLDEAQDLVHAAERVLLVVRIQAEATRFATARRASTSMGARSTSPSGGCKSSEVDQEGAVGNAGCASRGERRRSARRGSRGRAERRARRGTATEPPMTRTATDDARAASCARDEATSPATGRAPRCGGERTSREVLSVLSSDAESAPAYVRFRTATTPRMRALSRLPTSRCPIRETSIEVAGAVGVAAVVAAGGAPA